MDEEVNPIAEKTEILELEVIVAVWGGGGAGLAEDKGELEEQIRSLFLTFGIRSTQGHPREKVWPGKDFRTAVRTPKERGSVPMQVSETCQQGLSGV